jgi:lipopolysaccharide assembly protein A
MAALRFIFWAAVAVALIIVGIANRGLVTLRALPEGLASLLGLSPDIDLPLFVVIFLGVAAGLLIGFVWEWLREARQRAEARAKGREVEALQREVGRLKSQANVGKDEVLALLDEPVRR